MKVRHRPSNRTTDSGGSNAESGRSPTSQFGKRTILNTTGRVVVSLIAVVRGRYRSKPARPAFVHCWRNPWHQDRPDPGSFPATRLEDARLANTCRAGTRS